MTFHVMLIPTLDCPSNCSYCWGSKKGSGMMNIQIIEDVVKWLKNFREEPIHFTFHGGEPLLAGIDFYKKALPLLKNGEYLDAGFSLQSNLWLIDDEMAQLFHDYGVAVSTSIDGPQELNDYQRGEGYFEKTMNGYEIAKSHEVRVSFICTFTSYSKDYYDDIYNFFADHGFNIKLHAALPSMRDNNADSWALEPEEHGDLLIKLLDKYLENLDKIEIKDFDHLCKSVFIRRGTLCTLADCMGGTFAVGHDGNIYPCYRFVGMNEYIMGNVKDHPSMEDLMESPAWEMLQKFKKFVDEDCKKCNYIKFCRGGCPYNAINANEGSPKAVDPHCTAYKMIFKDITDRANKDFLNSSSIPMPGMPLQKKVDKNKKASIMDLMLKR